MHILTAGRAGLASAFVAGFCLATPASAEADRAALAAEVQTIADDYLAKHGKDERLTAVSISISLPGGGEPVNVVAGAVSDAAGAAAVTPATLYQIGSISKSFTAATLLQLQSEGKLSLDDTLGTWTPEYPAWKDVSIRRLLNMTSGIEGYDNVDAATRTFKTIGYQRHFTPAVLVGFSDPTYPGAPKPTTGYDYSNTNFILAGMVIERASGKSVKENFESRFFGETYGLTDSHYVEGVYPPDVTDRMASGYFVGTEFPDLNAFEKDDIKLADMSWAGAAGGIVSSPAQVNDWVRALFLSDMLDDEAKRQLTHVVSMKDGKDIGTVSKDDPRGFGLGVAGFTNEFGEGWNYEGETMGYRVIYVLLPDRDLVATVGLNSAPQGKADHGGDLIRAIISAAMDQAD